MAMSKERFKQVLENEWTPTENSTLWNESVRYVHECMVNHVKPTRQGMALFCKPKLSGRTVSAIENHLHAKGWWVPTHRRNNKKRRKSRRRPVQLVNSARSPVGKVRLQRTFKCPGCNLESEVI